MANQPPTPTCTLLGIPPSAMTAQFSNSNGGISRNFASDQASDQNLELLNSIYANVASRAGSVLSPQELQKFEEFQNLAIKNNRLALALNPPSSNHPPHPT